MRRALSAVVVLLLLVSPAKALDLCQEIDYSDRLAQLYAADPETLAAAWLPLHERLYAAIPSLSPREQQWLKEEMQSYGKRSVAAHSSRENAIV